MRRRDAVRRAARRIASWTHLYLGLVTGLVLSVVGVTGTVLVFHDEIDALLAPELHRVEAAPGAQTAPLDRVVAAAGSYEPGHTPSYVRLPRHPGESAEIWTDGEAGPAVFVDPYTAEALGSTTGSLTDWLFELHVELFAGEVGHWVVGSSAVALILMLLSGLVLWWPKAYRWARALFDLPRGSWRRINYRLHEMSGAWSTVGLLVLAVTGASLVFHDAFSAALHAVTASEAPPPPPTSVVPAVGSAGAVDAAVGSDAPLAVGLSNARAALPDGRPTWIYLPTAPDAPLSVRMRRPGEWHPNGRSYVYVDRYSGQVLRAHDALESQLGTRIYDVLYPLHIGRFGLWSKILYALLGLAPLLLSIGGTIIWLDRRARKRARGDRQRAFPEEMDEAA